MEAAINNPVGRPRGFDEAVVLARVMDTFLRQGYDGTSMSDILRVTGLHKGSIYKAFGDKHSLFVQALRAYTTDMRKDLQRVTAQAESGVEALRRASYYHIEHGLNDDGTHSGCLALNTLVETAQGDPEVMAVLEKAYAMRSQLMGEAIARAQAEGDMRPDWAPERLGQLIAAIEAGILVELKGMLDEADAKAMVDDMLESLR